MCVRFSVRVVCGCSCVLLVCELYIIAVGIFLTPGIIYWARGKGRYETSDPTYVCNVGLSRLAALSNTEISLKILRYRGSSGSR